MYKQLNRSCHMSRSRFVKNDKLGLYYVGCNLSPVPIKLLHIRRKMLLGLSGNYINKLNLPLVFALLLCTDELCGNAFRPHDSEQDNQLNMELGGPDVSESVPEIRYEVCHPRPLTAHRVYNDYGHGDKFGSVFLFRVTFFARLLS